MRPRNDCVCECSENALRAWWLLSGRTQPGLGHWALQALRGLTHRENARVAPRLRLQPPMPACSLFR